MIGAQQTLTAEQIATQYFVVPYLLITLAFDRESCIEFGLLRRKIEATGGELLMIGWPDGTTMTYQRHHRGDPIDIACITEVYQASAAMRRATS